MRTNDLDKKRLSEFQSYSVTELIEGIKPRLEPLGSIQTELLAMKKSMGEMEERLVTKIQLTTEDVLEAMEEAGQARNGEFMGVLKHLESKGLVDRGSTYNIPTALEEILDRVKNEHAGPPIMGTGKPTVVDEGRMEPQIVDKVMKKGQGKEGSKGLVEEHVSGSGDKMAMDEGTGGKASVKCSVIKSGASKIQDWENDRTRVGILPTPAAFKFVEQNYMLTNNMAKFDHAKHQVKKKLKVSQFLRYKVTQPGRRGKLGPKGWPGTWRMISQSHHLLSRDRRMEMEIFGPKRPDGTVAQSKTVFMGFQWIFKG